MLKQREEIIIRSNLIGSDHDLEHLTLSSEWPCPGGRFQPAVVKHDRTSGSDPAIVALRHDSSLPGIPVADPPRLHQPFPASV
jgi:hypothetical protein